MSFVLLHFNNFMIPEKDSKVKLKKLENGRKSEIV